MTTRMPMPWGRDLVLGCAVLVCEVFAFGMGTLYLSLARWGGSGREGLAVGTGQLLLAGALCLIAGLTAFGFLRAHARFSGPVQVLACAAFAVLTLTPALASQP